MKKKYTQIILALTLLLSAAGCRKESPNIMNPEDVTYFRNDYYPSEIFNHFWNAMNSSYLFWDIDQTDWDAIYTQYEPKFKELDIIYDTETAEDKVEIDNYEDGGETTIMVYPSKIQSFEYYKEMIANLSDYHYTFELKGVGYKSPANDRVKSRDYYHDYSEKSNDLELVWNATNGKQEVFTRLKRASYEGAYNFSIYSAEIDGIALLSFSNFAITGIKYLNEVDLVPEASNATLDEVLENYFEITQSESFKGAIFDLRSNTGGYCYDLNLLFDDFINKDDYITFMKSRQKNGPGRLDYSPYIDVSINGQSSSPTQSFPIVSLINLYSVSMSEVSSLFFKEFNPNSIWIGERSFGGQSLLNDDSIYAGGIIENDYIYIYTPSLMMSDINEVCHEGVGLTPDIEILYNDVIDELKLGNDIIMDRAIEYLNNIN
ncbi:MAG: S41 family peptidase [Rikenellaceae bacterium]